MAGARVKTTRKYAVGVILACFLQLIIPTIADVNQCQEKVKRCTCNYGGDGGEVDVDNSGQDYDGRTVGLAGATGALGGVLAAGSAVAAYLRFRSGSGSGGSAGGGGGGGAEKGGGSQEMKERWRRDGGGGGKNPPQRPDSSGSSNGSYGSQSPLTKRDSGGGPFSPSSSYLKSPALSRFRPFTGASSVSSNTTNIHSHAKVWPGKHGGI